MKNFILDCTPNAEQELLVILDSCKNTEATITLREGIYSFQKGITLTEEHKNITLLGEGKVRLLGGQTLTHWKSVDGTPIANRFNSEARKHILMCELSEEGIKKTGAFSSRGFMRTASLSHSELFSDGVPMRLSQYPKGDEFLTITDCPQHLPTASANPLSEGFFYSSDRPKQWQPSDSIWALGYWAHDWSNSTERVAALDAEKQFVLNAPPYGNYGYRIGQRFRFYHILEEVTDPGDYYIDIENNIAYIYPFQEGEKITISVLEQPVIRLLGSEGITLRNLSIDTVRGDAIFMKYANNCTIDNCTIYNIGNYGVDILEGRNNSVINCTIHDCGDGGILCYAGNRCTLDPANAVFNNNHIYKIAKWTKCYQPAIHMIGVGMTARHNLIHDCPHTGIMYWGNDITIEDNEIYSVVLETGDAGAVYTGRDYTFRGNSVSHNFIHHLGGVGMGTMGIYNDDAVSGTKMNNNYFMELTRGAFMGGGRKFEVKNNVFVKCDPAIAIDSRSADNSPGWVRNCNLTMRERFYEIHHFPNNDSTTEENRLEREKTNGETANAMTGIYIKRYPELKEIDEYYKSSDDVRIPGEAYIAHNVFCSKPRFRYTCDGWPVVVTDYGVPIPYDRKLKAYILDVNRDVDRSISADKGHWDFDSNFIANPYDFTDADWSIISVKDTSEAKEYGYTDSDFYSIGLQKELRNQNPVTVWTTVQWRPGDEYLTVGFRNTEEIDLQGDARLFVSPDVSLEATAIHFELAAKEERFYRIKVNSLAYESSVELRSDLPGVRPSRL